MKTSGEELLARVRDMKPYDRFRYYINTRIAIRQRRLDGLPREKWTVDPILSKYKFTNARRSWDYTSRWLIDNWYSQHGSEETCGIVAAFARFFCFVPTFETVGYPTHVNKWLPSEVARNWLKRSEIKLLRKAEHGNKVFTSAYIIGGVKAGQNKISWVIREYLLPVHEDRILRSPWKGEINELHNALREFNGWGDFMTQEVVLDLMYTFVLKSVPQSKKRLYGFAGPGAMRGLNWLWGFRPDNREHAQDMMVSTWGRMCDDTQVDKEYRRVLTVHDIEFNLCEFDKYSRTLFGEGKPKQLFTPREIEGEPVLL